MKNSWAFTVSAALILMALCSVQRGYGETKQENSRQASEQPSPAAVKGQNPGVGTQPAPAADSTASFELSKIDDHRLKLSGGSITLAPGWQFKSMLLLQGNHLAVLGADGITISKIHELGTAYKRIAERANYYVALVEQPPAIDLLDKKTLATIRHITFKGAKADDMAIHPTKPITYATSIKATLQANGSFVIVDETSGDVRESPEYLGQWLEVDAAGQRLVAAGMFSRIIGQELVAMPGNGRPNQVPQPGVPRAMPRPGARPMPGGGGGVRVVTRRESIEGLLVYDLHDDGSARPADLAVRHAGRSRGLRMSPDGMRATFLMTGPVNRDALNLDALDEKPVTYSGGADHTGGANNTAGADLVVDVAYHPVLPLVACVGDKFSIVCDRETGAEKPAALKAPPADLANARFQCVCFSADGKGVLFDMTAATGERSLYRADLDLSAAEVAKVRHRLENMAALGRDLLADHAPEPGKGSVPLSEIDAFNGSRGQTMTPAEIGRAYTNAVVIVQNDESSGTGFVVGKSGYILTCAHCVRGDKNSVSYRTTSDGTSSMKTVPAKVLCSDAHKDIALLKIDGAPALPTVSLAIGDEVESGERVIIIGNPGLGGQILDYTMTEGIVSNARRQLRHEVLIQTSAAVNPGTSGGPMFNDKGLVVGLVALKGQIENAGFAVRADDVGQFLARAVNATGPAATIQRHWLDATGQKNTEAKYVGFRDGAVQLTRADGTAISVPLSKLSRRDQAFIRLMRPDATSASPPSG